MKYILDFDRTLFDVEKLYLELEQQNKSHLAGTLESLEYLAMPDLLFPDVTDFLSNKQRADLFILSSTSGLSAQWESDYQLAKIVATGLDQLVEQVQVVTGEKAQAVHSLVQQFSAEEQIIFVDDRLEHCQTVQMAVPHSHCFLIDRQQTFNQGDFQQKYKNITLATSLTQVEVT